MLVYQFLGLLLILTTANCSGMNMSTQKLGEVYSFSLKAGEKIGFNYNLQNLSLPLEETVFKLNLKTKEQEEGHVRSSIFYKNFETVILGNTNFNGTDGEKDSKTGEWAFEKSMCLSKIEEFQDGKSVENEEKVMTIFFEAEFNCYSSILNLEARLIATPIPRIKLHETLKINLGEDGGLHLFQLDVTPDELKNVSFLLTETWSTSVTCKSTMIYPLKKCPSNIVRTNPYWQFSNIPLSQKRVIYTDMNYPGNQNGFLVGVSQVLDPEAMATYCANFAENVTKSGENYLTLRIQPSFNPQLLLESRDNNVGIILLIIVTVSIICIIFWIVLKGNN